MDAFRCWVPTEVIFDRGCLDSLDDHVRNLGNKAFVVTGKNSAKQCGALDQVLPRLGNGVLFDDVEENPTTGTCERAAEICRREGCDFVVAIGGGSPMDAAKAIAVLSANDGGCADFVGMDLFETALPIIAIPTTAGTGSEVTPYAVLVDESKGPHGTKQTIGGRGIFPKVALLDPELTHTLPRDATIATGLDALSQGMEGIVSKRSTPLTDVMGLEICRLVKQWLPRAASDGADSEARAHLLYAAMLSGWVVAHTGTTLVHGMGYYYTLAFGVAHGLANALLLTPLFQHNATIEPDKVATIAGALGVSSKSEPEGAARGIGDAIHVLLDELGVSPCAGEAGVVENLLPVFAKEIWDAKLKFDNQLGEMSEAKVREFFQQSFEGGLGS